MKRGTPDHPKMKDLAKRLGIPVAHAVGIMEMLWHFTAKHAPQGDIGKFSDSAIAEAVGWQRPTGERGVTPECKLREALVGAKWLDSDPVYRLLVHDWEHHADQQVIRLLARQKLAFAKPKLALPLPLPLPKPLPLPQEPQPKAITVEFPKSSAFIKRQFPTTDDAMVRSIVDRAVQEVIGAGEAPELVTDEVLLEALMQCTSKKQYSAALYLNTVGTWMRNMASTE